MTNTPAGIPTEVSVIYQACEMTQLTELDAVSKSRRR